MMPARSCSAVIAVWKRRVRVGPADCARLGPQPRTKVSHPDVIGIPFSDLCTRLCPNIPALWASPYPTQVTTSVLTGSVCRVPSPAASFAMRTPPTKTSVAFRPGEFMCLIDVIGAVGRVQVGVVVVVDAVRRVQVGGFTFLLSTAGPACQDIE